MPNSLELNVSPAQLHTFANHPFHVRKDMEMNELVDSIRESGVIVPLIVRSRPEGGYEIISGHRRCEACRELGIEKVPVRVQELTDDEATILMVNSNIQREHVLPSEKAFAYKMKMDAMKHQGRATSCQLGTKLRQFVKEYFPKSLRNREGFWYNRRKPPREAPSWKSTPKTPAARQWSLTSICSYPKTICSAKSRRSWTTTGYMNG